jgi:hypothetical protein
MAGMLLVQQKIDNRSRRRIAEDRAYVLLTAMEADRHVTSKIIKPALWEEFGKETFVVEAMSSSFGARNVFNRIREQYPDYHFKHSCFDPRNRRNLADAAELEVLNVFLQHTELEEWSGVQVIQDEERWVVAKPIFHKTRCAGCHGNPSDAPQDILETYGSEYAFGRKDGDLIGALLVSVPLQTATGHAPSPWIPQALGASLIVFPFLFALRAGRYTPTP